MGAADVLADFHATMALLNTDALETIDIAPVSHLHIGECEAILLALWRDGMTDARTPQMLLTLQLMVAAETVLPLTRALTSAARGFADHDLAPSGLESLYAGETH